MEQKNMEKAAFIYHDICYDTWHMYMGHRGAMR